MAVSHAAAQDDWPVLFALADPATAEGVTWDDDALSHVVDRSGRYPYFIQQFGQEAWNAASGTRIDARAAELGVVAFTVPGMAEFISRQHGE
ncbi:hypothetical protein [Actinomyces sp. zg328]|uniref:hypothetical protein n=1 Tax=Actinomyces sp. zg328 TaxID=2609287 RepID=UPI001915E4AB|nr:hypothetical protein [Actinomyces sp. zg328]